MVANNGNIHDVLACPLKNTVANISARNANKGSENEKMRLPVGQAVT